MAQAQQSKNSALLEQYVGQQCQYCEEGSIREGDYKDTPAAICPNCETPALRLF